MSIHWPARMSIRTVWSSFRFLIAMGVGLTGLVALAIGLTVWWLYTDAIADASKDANNLAIVMAHQLDSSMQSVELVLNEIRDKELEDVQLSNDVDRTFSSERTFKFLTERLSHLKQAEFVGLVDRAGRLLNTTRYWPPPKVNVSDRTYFQHFKDSDDKGVYITNSLFDRIRGSNIILLSKRINDANNTLLGLVTVAIRIEYFKHIYELVARLPNQSFLLSHRNGTVIMRYPDPINRSSYRIPAESPWYQLVFREAVNIDRPAISTTRHVWLPFIHWAIILW